MLDSAYRSRTPRGPSPGRRQVPARPLHDTDSRAFGYAVEWSAHDYGAEALAIVRMSPPREFDSRAGKGFLISYRVALPAIRRGRRTVRVDGHALGEAQPAPLIISSDVYEFQHDMADDARCDVDARKRGC